MTFFTLELYERFRWKHITAKNDIIIDAQIRRAEFTQAFSKSLWDEPWFSYKKNQTVFFNLDGKRFQIKTNNFGLRGDAVSLEKPRKAFRILCIGGSTTVEGWTNDTTYPNILGKKLQEAFPNIPIEVINGGISGLDSFGELRKLRDYLAMSPDLILEYNVVNDICWRYFPYLKENTSAWKRLLMQSDFLARHMNRFLLPEEKCIKEYFQKTAIHNLSAIYTETKKNGVPVIFCSFSRPRISQLSPEEMDALDYDLKYIWQSGFVNFKSYCRLVDIYNRSLEKFCEKNNIPYIPVAENMAGGVNFFIDICHATPEGIEKKASVILDYLKPRLSDYFPPELLKTPIR